MCSIIYFGHIKQDADKNYILLLKKYFEYLILVIVQGYSFKIYNYTTEVIEIQCLINIISQRSVLYLADYTCTIVI